MKSGAIIPMTLPNNHVTEIDKGLRMYEVYPAGESAFTEYDDDGRTEAYKEGKGITTFIESSVKKNTATITVHPAKGDYNGFEKNKTTEFRVNLTQQPTGITAKLGNRLVKLIKTVSKETFLQGTNVYYYDVAPGLNRFATKGSEFEKMIITKNPQLLVKIAATDITVNAVALTVNGFRFAPGDHIRKSSGALTAPVKAQVSDSNTQAYSLKPTWKRVPNADCYEILFDGQLYTNIKDTTLLFEDVTPETSYTFRLRAVNKTGSSAWAQFSAKTKMNPLEFAIKGIVGESTAASQEGSEISSLFDFDESSMWHTKWGVQTGPFDLVMDLMSVNQLEKIQYLPRNRGNGILLKGKISYSLDKINWNEAGSFEWARNGDTKEFGFPAHPTARFIRISINDGMGGYGSGRELYVFRVPGSESFISGDINNDHRIDNNDLTSYINYTGLRKGDGDFEGYVSKGDVNKNDLIDAYDISTVATLLDGGVNGELTDSLTGKLAFVVDKKSYNKDEIVDIHVKGINLKAVNALSFALPYNAKDYEFAGIVPVNTKSMNNMTNDRLHSNRQKALYPTFVNVGDQETLEGTTDLFIIKLRANRKVNFDLKLIDGILVDKHLNVVKF